jgi:hypothetical protein
MWKKDNYHHSVIIAFKPAPNAPDHARRDSPLHCSDPWREEGIGP